MPGGLLSLVCYGNENIQLNGNPQTTWFYKTFMRYTHFSQEPIQIPLEGPNLLLTDSPILLKAKIPRQGDLLSDLVFRFQLPDIFSKAYISEDHVGNLNLDRAYEFAWVRQIGARLIDTVTFTIGGQIIQEFTSDWICARALLDHTNEKYEQWRAMVGDTPEYFDPSNGIYADPSGGYPNVVSWRDQATQNNAPSIPGRIIRVPLGLWFSDYIANSLPLIALQYHDCEITMKLRPIRDLYTVLDPSGVRLRSNMRSLPYIPTDQYTTVWKPNLYGPLPPSLNNLYGASTDPLGSMKYFLTDIGPVSTPDPPYFERIDIPETLVWSGAANYAITQGGVLATADQVRAYLLETFGGGGAVDGDCWAPVSDGENFWIWIGRTYPERIGKLYQEVNGDLPPWGEDPAAYNFRNHMVIIRFNSARDTPGRIPLQDGWPLNATLEATYTFVREEEQQAFVKKTVKYNVRQVQNFIFSGINTRNSYRLDVHNIATRLVYFGRRSDALPYRNQATNLTNWINTQSSSRPFATPTSRYPQYVRVKGVSTPIGRSGINLAGLQRRILRNVFFTANGTQLFDSEDPSYFTEYVPYKFLKGDSAPFNDYSLASQSEMWPLHTYSFALNASSVEQPDGTLNTSRIDRLEIDVDVEPIPFLARYTYDLYVFVETLNFLEISSGLGGLKFAK